MNSGLLMPSAPLIAAMDAMRKPKNRPPLGEPIGFRPLKSEEAEIAEWCEMTGLSDGDIAKECLRRYGFRTVKDIILERESHPGYKAVKEEIVGEIERDIEAATSKVGPLGPSRKDKKER